MLSMPSPYINMIQQQAQSWSSFLLEMDSQLNLSELLKWLEDEIAAGKNVFPARENIFAALARTPFEKVKVVVLGQDPYHSPGQAHGLSFSVPENIPAPPSLKNIFKELRSDLGCEIPTSGQLTSWAEQGVLLLNSVLTVEAGRPGSHRNKGWENFTDQIIRNISARKTHVVFVLWGAYAQSKLKYIDQEKHLVLIAPHPSPLSCYRGFFGSKPFSQINSYLRKTQQSEIDWRLS